MKKKAFLLLMGLFILSGVFGVLRNPARAEAKSHKYKICVNKQMNCLTIYKKDKNGEYTKPVKAFICSTGYATPIGDFKIEIQYRWKELIHNSWGQYCSRVTWDGIIIHSVWYYGQNPAAQSTSRFNMLGTTCSNGCINLTTQDCKWIYDHCDVGTPIHIYNSSKPGPLGKPKMLKVPQAANDRGYDPTDIWTKGNPYIKKMPKLSGVKNRKVKYGEKFNALEGITATNTTGYDAKKCVETVVRFNGEVVDKVNTKEAGVYEVTYKLKDEIGRKVVKTANVTVVDTVKPELKHVKDRSVEYGTDITESLVLENVTAKWHKEDITDKIKVTIEQKSDSRYKVIYEVEAPNGKTAKDSCIFTVEEDKSLRFEGAEDRMFDTEITVTESLALEGVKVFAGSTELALPIQVQITEQNEAEEHYYEVVYSVEYEETVYTKAVKFYLPNKAGEPVSGGAIQ